MVSTTSLSILSSSTLPSSSSSSSSSSPFDSPSFYNFRRKSPRISSNNLPQFRRITQSLYFEEDGGSPDRFLQNNSIADYMRFKKGDSGELQTAVVSYRKRFPWYLLQPLLQVDLVSTIHIADKE